MSSALPQLVAPLGCRVAQLDSPVGLARRALSTGRNSVSSHRLGECSADRRTPSGTKAEVGRTELRADHPGHRRAARVLSLYMQVSRGLCLSGAGGSLP